MLIDYWSSLWQQNHQHQSISIKMKSNHTLHLRRNKNPCLLITRVLCISYMTGLLNTTVSADGINWCSLAWLQLSWSQDLDSWFLPFTMNSTVELTECQQCATYPLGSAEYIWHYVLGKLIKVIRLKEVTWIKIGSQQKVRSLSLYKPIHAG